MSKTIDTSTVLHDVMCMFRSGAEQVPVSDRLGQQGFGTADSRVPCRRDCAIFDKEAGCCSLLVTMKAIQKFVNPAPVAVATGNITVV